MAEKKAAGKGKKLLIIFIALVAIVAVVLALVFLLPKGKGMAEQFKEVCAVTIADSEEAKADYAHFEEKVDQTEGVKYYAEEIDALRTMIVSIDEVADFYNEYYLFAQYNKYNGEIGKAILQIRGSQKNLNSIMAIAKRNIEGGMTHVQNVWVDYRAEFLDLISGYKNLFAAMNKVYHEDLADVTVSNPASQEILKGIEGYMNVFVRDVKKLVDTNIKSSKAETYSLGTLALKVKAFSQFVSKNIIDRKNIERYYLTTPVAYDYIGMFKEKFNHGFENVIDTITLNDSSKLEFTYTSEIIANDANAAVSLVTTKTFLLGGAV